MSVINIKTSFNPKPIPIRNFDWDAIDDNTYDGEGSAIGHGATEQEAVNDLLMQIINKHETGCDCEFCTFEARATGKPDPKPSKGEKQK